MQVIDLTHLIKEDMPVYPGTLPPSLKVANTIEKDLFKETLLSLYSHTGTHSDAPAHIIKGAKTLDGFTVDQFIGKALVIDCKELNGNEAITMAILNKYQDKLDKVDFLLFNTGWDKYWGQDRYFSDYPCVDEEVLDYIIKANYKGVGLDTISLDPMNKLTRHTKLFNSKEMVIIENLTNLDLLGNDIINFACLPLKFTNSDGAPSRAIAWFE